MFTGPQEDPRRYRVDDLNAGRSGGQGIVYAAFDQSGQRVALKLLSGCDVDLERVLTFAPALARLQHPNLARQIDVFVGTALCEADAPRGPHGNPFDVLYTVCEWIEGVDLTDAIRNASVTQRLGWVADVARGVATLHAERSVPGGIIHRDVKPSNVRVTPEGRAVLVDYGCAREVDGAPMTQNVGTPGWRAPEYVQDPDRVGPAADAWGVAAIAFWSFTGEAPLLVSKPVHQETLEISARRAGVREPRRLAAIVAALLATEQDTRPKDLVRWADKLMATERAGGRRIKVATAVTALALGGLAMAQFGVPEWSARGQPTVGAGTATTSPFSGQGALTSQGASDVAPGLTTTVPGAGNSDGQAPITVPGAGELDIKASLNPPGGASGTLGTPGAAQPTTSAPTSQTTPSITAAPPTTRTPTTTPVTRAGAQTTWAETTGGDTRTWTNYLNAGGQAGSVIPRGTTVQISCRIQGFPVENGNTWWYRIASSPWSNNFYASADAFYNNGATSGSLIGTPWVDENVANC